MKIFALVSASVLALVVAAPASAQDFSNKSFISQIGQFNDANVDQRDDRNYSLVSQEGTNLDATVRMGTVAGRNNESTILQNAHDDSALVEINGNKNTSVVLQSASAFVSGDNRSETRMSGDNGVSLTTQSGRGNYSNVTFSPGSNGSASYVVQDGADNDAIVASGDRGNVSLISQTFDGNYANVFQVGNANLSAVVQDGLSNSAVVVQY